MKYYKAKDVFQVIDTIMQKATEEVIEAIKSVDLVIEINKLPTIEVSEDCSDYYKGSCARYEDGCFHQCKNASSVVPTQNNATQHIESVERAEGEWKHEPDCGITKCIKCGWSIEECIEWNYCPNCGAKMKGAEE